VDSHARKLRQTTSARAPSQAERAIALGSRLRRLRRAAKLTQRQLRAEIKDGFTNIEAAIARTR